MHRILLNYNAILTQRVQTYTKSMFQFPLAVALFNLDVNATFKDNNINSQKTAAMYLLRGLDLKTASGYTSRFPDVPSFASQKTA